MESSSAQGPCEYGKKRKAYRIWSFAQENQLKQQSCKGRHRTHTSNTATTSTWPNPCQVSSRNLKTKFTSASAVVGIPTDRSYTSGTWVMNKRAWDQKVNESRRMATHGGKLMWAEWEGLRRVVPVGVLQEGDERRRRRFWNTLRFLVQEKLHPKNLPKILESGQWWRSTFLSWAGAVRNRECMAMVTCQSLRYFEWVKLTAQSCLFTNVAHLLSVCVFSGKDSSSWK